MKIAGIVAEYNPFHAGHAHHIAATRRILGGDCAVVAVMSGNWVQRGDCAVFDKWARARRALEGGADLIFELPTPWAMASAERFAQGAVLLLEATGVVTHLSFGSECGDVDKLRRVAACLDSPRYPDVLRRFLNRGLPFAACRQRGVEQLLRPELADLLSGPNNNLGIEYIRALNAMDSAIEPVTVLRVGAGHDGGDHPDYPSASLLRERLRAGTHAPEGPADLRFGERWVLAALRSVSEEDFAALPDCGEGLSHRLYRAVRQGRTLEEICTLAKTKRYAHSRIRRAVLWGALGLGKQDWLDAPLYLRVLGFNRRGREVLHEMKGRAALPILTKPAHIARLEPEAQALFALEERCTDLYGLCLSVPAPCGRERTSSPAADLSSPIRCTDASHS